MSDIEFPCTNCICIAICRSMYADNIDNVTKSDSISMAMIAARCSLLTDYVDQDFIYFRHVVQKYYKHFAKKRRKK